MADVPVLETARLRLRAHRPSDLDDCAAMWADPAVTRFTGGRAFTHEETWARLLRYAGHWTWFGFGFWLVEALDGGGFVGELGFAHFERAVEPPLGVPEAGWSFAAQAHGKGYAGEALAAALAWGDARGIERTACLIDPGNAASIRVAARAGFVEVARPHYKGGRTIMFERPTSSPRARR